MGAKSPEGVLARRGPVLSSELVRALQQGGASAAAARKKVARAVGSGSVHRLARLNFPHNQGFLYLPSQYRSARFWTALIKALGVSHSAYGLVVSSLALRGGVSPLGHFDVLSGSPLALRGHLASKVVLDNLLAIGLLDQETDPSLGDVVKFTNSVPLTTFPRPTIRARLIAEDVMLLAVQEWLRRTGIASYNRIVLRPALAAGPGPEFGHFRWDLTAPSYIHPLASRARTGPTPGFVVADVALGEEVSEAQAAHFMRKLELLRAQRRVRPALTLLIASHFSQDALRVGRAAGALFVTPGALLGKDVAAALDSLISVLSNAAQVAAANPAKVDLLMTQLGKIEGAATNLRGPLFELIVGMCVREHEGTSIDMGVKAVDPRTRESADIDVLRVKGHTEVWAYECKGREPHGVVTLGQVEDWLTRQVPRIDAWFRSQDRFSGYQLGVAFWSSGHFEPEALVRLKQASANTQRYRISWKDGDAVYAYAEEARHAHAKKLLTEHFRNHPLSRHFREASPGTMAASGTGSPVSP